MSSFCRHGTVDTFREALRFALLAAQLLLAGLVVTATTPAHADWIEVDPIGNNFGADAMAAAEASYNYWYGVQWPQSSASYYISPITDQVVDAEVCHTDPQWPFYIYCGEATNRCSSGQVLVQGGCASSIDEPGCSGDSGEPDESGQCQIADPVNIASGNLFEAGTDYKTVARSR